MVVRDQADGRHSLMPKHTPIIKYSFNEGSDDDNSQYEIRALSKVSEANAVNMSIEDESLLTTLGPDNPYD